MKKNEKRTVSLFLGAKEAYEAKVALEAVERVGMNKNLKGVVHEILYRDLQNVAPTNIISGIVASLTKSTTAARDDVILKQANQVVGRAQLKDTANSIAQTLKQVSEAKYRGTELLGTNETVAAYNAGVARYGEKGIEITQKMKSTNISSADTARIAEKALGGKVATSAIAQAAGRAGLVGAGISCAISVFSAGKHYADGNISGGEFIKHVVKETTGGGISAAAGTVAGTVTTTAAATVLAATTAPAWAPIALGTTAAVAAGVAIKAAWDVLFD